jgi:hypothetical protein
MAANSAGLATDNPIVQRLRARPYGSHALFEPTVLDDIPARPYKPSNSKESSDVDQR